MTSEEIDLLRDHYENCMRLAKEWGLKPFEIDFHIVPPDKMYEISSYGIPGHFSHWTYGRDYWKQKSSYDYGRSKIYELIINSNPAQAFLLENNSLLENMLIVAHCIGHSDFFANNVYFEHTTRHIEHGAAALSDRIRAYELEYGRLVVEEFIDQVLSIRYQIDPNLRIKPITTEYDLIHSSHKFEDLFPEDRASRERDELEERVYKTHKFPYQPQRDLLHFIAQYGKLQEWQRDIMLGIREEMLYFLPQIQTKIMNEGWASVIHHKLMHDLDPQVDPGGFDFASMHSAVLASVPGNLNPYWLGYNIYQRIIDVWGENDDDLSGWEKVLEVRATDSDETFIRNYLDEKICQDLNLFAFEFRRSPMIPAVAKRSWWEVTSTDWEEVRDALCATKENLGIPYIEVTDADYGGSGQLYLAHCDDNPLDEKFSLHTLVIIEKLWGRPVHLETCTSQGSRMVYTSMQGTMKKRLL